MLRDGKTCRVTCDSGKHLQSLDAPNITDRRGVNSNKLLGCDSIVVSRQDSTLGERDNFHQLRYACTSKSGYHAFNTSLNK